MKRSELVRDGAGVAGVGLVSYGAWLAWAPAGYLVAGLLLLAGAVLHALSAKGG
jgi:hypothetical protein